MHMSSQETRFGRIVLDLVRGRSSPPPMKGKLPLEILAEIGEEKLRRDYAHAFMCKK